MNNYSKILCVCRSGYVRSVETKRNLNKRGYKDVLSVGVDMVSKATFDMLCKWAEIILLAKPEHGRYIDPEYESKVIAEFYIGDDTEQIVKKQLDKIGL